jgi:fission process protein 1
MGNTLDKPASPSNNLNEQIIKTFPPIEPEPLPLPNSEPEPEPKLITEFPEETVYARYVGRMLGKPHLLMQKSRPLAYASEVGESFRPIVPRWLVNSAYGISIGYVFADTLIHTYNVRQILKKSNNTSNDNHNKQIAINFADKAIWHTFASMVLPAVSIHSIVKYSGICLKHEMDHMQMFKSANVESVARIAKYSRWGSVFIGLTAIPFIIHPLDHLTDLTMDRTIRRLYPGQLVDTHACTHSHLQ